MSTTTSSSSPSNLPFSPSCPSGGSFYACPSGARFVGCCTGDPCINGGNSGCSAGRLQPASFDPKRFATFSDQQCPSGSLWYTCAATNPPFMGCCKSNPCGTTTGCPVQDLAAGFLSSNPAEARDFLGSGAAVSSSAGTATSSAASTATASTAPNLAPVSSSKSSDHTAIIGGAVGGAVGLVLLFCILAFAVFFIRRRRRQQKKKNKGSANPLSPDQHSAFLPQGQDFQHQQMQQQQQYHYSQGEKQQHQIPEWGMLPSAMAPMQQERKVVPDQQVFELHGKDKDLPELHTDTTTTPRTPAPPYYSSPNPSPSSSSNKSPRSQKQQQQQHSELPSPSEPPSSNRPQYHLVSPTRTKPLPFRPGGG